MTLRLETDPRGIARLTLSRPERHNALDAPLMDALTEAAHRIARDPAIRVVVLASTGPTFCAGGDLGWMRAQTEADGPTRAAEARRLAGMLHALDTLPKPLIAEVRGPAYGGGVGLLAVCDIAVAADTATFAMTETRLGLIPATIGPYVLARIGEPAARRLMLPARRFDATEAVALQLLARAVSPDALAAAVEEEATAFLACAPGAVADAKALIHSLRPPVPDAVERSVAALVARWESEEVREGLRAFFAREPTPWTRG
ncbi:crotonase/enoyl-CoA hydratase family protein [Rubellimicrobium roseum]|uniref:Crotonase/enoyl-CoA hydratase family protein n=1 Tax=Rubellimicrobium roseum TaxID=687525 RepID=A0A5C4NG43_9RHOB|nr:crotonase/enoyl-CoA hydratase family protein [Rubellimicrobium roseum]TNC73701.1 crotonase/enoyl-CoA hydratase family protein [Rubellimicrobium roseum]